MTERLGVSWYNYNWDRHSSWIELRYKGQLFRFDHSVEKAQAHGQNIVYGSDTFAQLVLALEDLARISGRGIYDLQTWIEGLKFLPPVVEVPSFFKTMGFDRIPDSIEDVKTRYKSLAKQYHPDAGGNSEDFMALKKASEDAMRFFKAKGEE